MLISINKKDGTCRTRRDANYYNWDYYSVSSEASEEAKTLNLTHKGFGKYADQDGKITHQTVGGKLTKLEGILLDEPIDELDDDEETSDDESELEGDDEETGDDESELGDDESELGDDEETVDGESELDDGDDDDELPEPEPSEPPDHSDIIDRSSIPLVSTPAQISPAQEAQLADTNNTPPVLEQSEHASNAIIRNLNSLTEEHATNTVTKTLGKYLHSYNSAIDNIASRIVNKEPAIDNIADREIDADGNFVNPNKIYDDATKKKLIRNINMILLTLVSSAVLGADITSLVSVVSKDMADQYCDDLDAAAGIKKRSRAHSPKPSVEELQSNNKEWEYYESGSGILLVRKSTGYKTPSVQPYEYRNVDGIISRRKRLLNPNSNTVNMNPWEEFEKIGGSYRIKGSTPSTSASYGNANNANLKLVVSDVLQYLKQNLNDILTHRENNYD